MIITNFPSNFKLNQINYDKIIASIDFDSIVCNSCSHHDWVFHATYLRSVDFLVRNVKIKIVRIICLNCGKTHAILVNDMIPFSILSHSDIINVLSSLDPDFVYSSHLWFLKSKYQSIDYLDYYRICLLNRRNFSIISCST